MRTCIILGAKSDIAQALTSLLFVDGWSVYGWARGENLPMQNWDLVIVCIGSVAPVGIWWSQNEYEWEECMRSNLFTPLRLLRTLWTFRNPGARVCFMAGSNPNAIMPGYSAYNTSKMALLKLIEQMDAETSDAIFFALGPGITDTKIHEATKQAGWSNPRLERALKDGSFTKMEDIYACLKWCLAVPKHIIGGRNICVSDPWNAPLDVWGTSLYEDLERNPSLYKLRRVEK